MAMAEANAEDALFADVYCVMEKSGGLGKMDPRPIDAGSLLD